MTETEDPGFAERDDDEFSEPTGDGVDPAELDLDDEGLADDDGLPADEDEEAGDF